MISEQLPDPDPPNRGLPRRRRSFSTDQYIADQDQLLEHLGREFEPTFDFFWLSFIAALILTIGNLSSASGVLVLGALLCANSLPVMGLGFSIPLQSFEGFKRNLAAILVGLAFAVISGMAGTWILTMIDPTRVPEIVAMALPYHWDMLILLVTGICAAAFFAAKQSPVNRIGLIGAGFVLFNWANLLGISIYQKDLYHITSYILLIAAGLFIAISVNVLVLYSLQAIRRRSNWMMIALLMLIIAVVFTWLGINLPSRFSNSTSLIIITPGMETAVPAPTLSPATATPLKTIPAPTVMKTPTGIPSPTSTKTPEMMVVQAEGQRGARLRQNPGLDGIVLDVLVNGVSVLLLGESEEMDDYRWQKIQTNDGKIGWIVDSALVIFQDATPTQELPTITQTN